MELEGKEPLTFVSMLKLVGLVLSFRFPSSSSCTQQHHHPMLLRPYWGELDLFYKDVLDLVPS